MDSLDSLREQARQRLTTQAEQYKKERDRYQFEQESKRTAVEDQIRCRLILDLGEAVKLAEIDFSAVSTSFRYRQTPISVKLKYKDHVPIIVWYKCLAMTDIKPSISVPIYALRICHDNKYIVSYIKKWHTCISLNDALLLASLEGQKLQLGKKTSN